MNPGEHGVDPAGDLVEQVPIEHGNDLPEEPDYAPPPEYGDWLSQLPHDFPDYDPYEP